MIVLRRATADDRDFLLGVYGSTRADELALVDWSDAAKTAFVEMQFDAQDVYYREYYPQATFEVVVVDGEPAGRLYVDRWPGEIRIVDIALLPERRNAGTGTELLRALMDEAAAAGKKLSIHVEIFNRAMRLYHRLGFVPVGDGGVHQLLEWAPASGDDGLVAHSVVVGAQRHEEQVELTELGVVQPADLLLEGPPAAGVEQEREGDAADGALPLVGGAVPRLLARGENHIDGLARSGRHLEHLPGQRDEGGVGEAL